jgi:hypothetical protein
VSNPAAVQQLAALRKLLQFHWFQRRSQRSSRSHQSVPNPATWLWPSAAVGLTTRAGAARIMRSASAALMLVLLSSLVLSSVPLRLSTPSWYLEVLALLGESISVIVVACVFVLLSFALDHDEQVKPSLPITVLRLSRIGYLLALLLLPLQLSAIAWLFADAFNSNRIQLNAVRSNAGALIAGAQQSTTSVEFVAYLRSRNISINLESIAQAPLEQVRSEFIRSVKTQQQQQEQNLAASTRTTMLRYAVNGLKLFLVLVILVAFLPGYLSILRYFYSHAPANNQSLDQVPNQALEIPSGQVNLGANGDNT